MLICTKDISITYMFCSSNSSLLFFIITVAWQSSPVEDEHKKTLIWYSRFLDKYNTRTWAKVLRVTQLLTFTKSGASIFYDGNLYIHQNVTKSDQTN